MEGELASDLAIALPIEMHTLFVALLQTVQRADVRLFQIDPPSSAACRFSPSFIFSSVCP